MKSLAPFALLLLILSSCGGSSTGAGTPVDNIQIFPTQEELLAALDQSSVVCEDKSNCPTNVAKLTFWSKQGNEFGLAVCSGTLVAKEFIITNSHCIPDNLTDGDDCSKQIIVQYPETNSTSKEKVSCQQVVKKFPMKEDQPDLAIIKIGRSFYNRFETTTLNNQFTEGLNVTAFTMNPSQTDSMKGTIVRKDCKISLSNLLTLEEDSNAGNVLIYGPNCNVIGGNSGSGLFDPNGNMIGVVHQKIESSLLSQVLTEQGVNHQPLTYMGVVVNTSCLKIEGSTVEKGCEAQGIGTKFPMIGQYIDSLVEKNGLLGENQDHIRLTIESNLSVSLTYDPSVQAEDSLTKMKATLVNLFTEAKAVFKMVIRKVSQGI